jgi:hypothetical protein
MRRVELRFQVRTLAFLVAGSALFSAGAGATTILITDKTSFVAATGATPVGAIPFSSSSADFTVGILTFENVSPSSVNHDRNWSTLISEPFDLAINGVENFDVASSSPLFSFGFDFHEPTTASPSFPDTCNAPCFDSTFQITLLNGVTPVGSHTFNMPNDQLTFVGVWSSDPFDRIEIRDTTGTIDNEFFGNFLTGNRALPEPTTVALLGVGLVALALRRRRAR